MRVVSVETKSKSGSNTLPPELMGRKVSEAFLEFANPLLRQIMAENPKLTAKECEFQLRVPWMGWNALVMKKKSDPCFGHIS